MATSHGHITSGHHITSALSGPLPVMYITSHRCTSCSAMNTHPTAAALSLGARRAWRVSQPDRGDGSPRRGGGRRHVGARAARRGVRADLPPQRLLCLARPSSSGFRPPTCPSDGAPAAQTPCSRGNKGFTVCTPKSGRKHYFCCWECFGSKLVRYTLYPALRQKRRK